MADDVLMETTGPLPETATEQPTVQVATESAAQATSPADSEHIGLRYLHKMLAWLKAEFEAIGLDIEAELKKL